MKTAQRPAKPQQAPQPCKLRLATRFLEASADPADAPNDANRTIPVLIIKEGMGNAVDRHRYDAPLLARCAAKFEGAQAYADHPTKTQEKDQPERSIRQLVGYYLNPHIVTIEGGRTAIKATLKIIEGDAYSWAWDLVKEAYNYAKTIKGKDLVGISINAYGISHAVEEAGQIVNIVDDLTEVQSADIVTRAGAGGGFRPLRESIKEILGGFMKPKKIAEVGSGIADMIAKHGEALKALHERVKADPACAASYGPALEELLAHHQEMAKVASDGNAAAHAEPDGDEPAPGTQPASTAPTIPVSHDEAFKRMEADYAAGKLSEREKVLFETLQKERRDVAIKENVAMVAGKIKGSGIPEAYQGDLAVLCAGKAEADVNKIIEARKALVAPLLGNKAQGAGASGTPQGGSKKSKLGESLASSGIKLREQK